MRFVILHESSSRIRVRVPKYNMTMEQADILEYYLRNKPFVVQATVHDRTSDASIRYRGGAEGRKALLEALRVFSFSDEKAIALVPEQTSRALDHKYQEKMVSMIMFRTLRNIFLPIWLRNGITIVKSAGFIAKGIKSLSKGKLEVATLDATAITVSMLRNDFDTASSVMFLLDIGDTLGEWTRRKSVTDLASVMSLNVTKVWKKTEDVDVLVDVKEVKPGDKIVVRTSNVIPLDGKVVEGSASVNQATMTGESIPVRKEPGGYVYAGTVVEDGSCVIEVAQSAGTGKYDQIVKIIEESEKLKSETEEKAFHLADRLVPYSLAGTVLTYLLTRNATRALSFLMVDFSCALNLSMPLSMLSAIKEASKYDISVKGGKFLEATATADTVIFDKTGTITEGKPKVQTVKTFAKNMKDNRMIVLAAAAEETSTHPLASAILNEVRNRGLKIPRHKEDVIRVARGIETYVNKDIIRVGSRRYMEENNISVEMSVDVVKGMQNNGEIVIYVAKNENLIGVIGVSDPPRENIKKAMNRLRNQGIDDIVLLTGDLRQQAETIANSMSMDRYESELLPEEKAKDIVKFRSIGSKVIMIGDGINDAPALSYANVGIALGSTRTDVAMEAADVTITSDDPLLIPAVIGLAKNTVKIIKQNFAMAIGINSFALVLGATGLLPAIYSSVLHNSITILVVGNSLRLLKYDVNK